jgi:hypothetical protein
MLEDIAFTWFNQKLNVAHGPLVGYAPDNSFAMLPSTRRAGR